MIVGATLYPSYYLVFLRTSVYTVSGGSNVERSTVPSNPGMNTSTQPQSYSGNQFQHFTSCPLPANLTPTIPKHSHQSYNIALQNSNKTFMLASSSLGLLDDRPNEVCNSQKKHQQQLLQKESDGWFSVSSDMLSDSSQRDLSPQATSGDSIGFPYAQGGMDLRETSGELSNMWAGSELVDQQMSLCEPVAVVEDDLLRIFVDPLSANPGSSIVTPGCELFQSVNDDYLSASTCADSMAEPDPVHSLDQVALESQFWNQTSKSSVQQTSDIEDSFQMIKMMKAKKTAATRNLTLPQFKQQEWNNLICTSATSVSIESESVSLHQNRPLAQSPCSSLSMFQSLTPMTPVQVSAPSPAYFVPMTPVQVSAPSPAYFVPMTPATSKRQFLNGPFKISSHLDGNCLTYEVEVREDLLDELKNGAHKMSSYSLEIYQQYERCMGMPFDLNMAITTRAKLCKFVLEENSWKLTSTMPADCKYGNSLLCGSIGIFIL